MKKIEKVLSFLALAALAVSCTGTPAPAPEISADEELAYCVAQTKRGVEGMKAADGTIDYTMQARNILEGETVWNLRKTKKDEWCSGFWPGVLWFAYEASGDEAIKTDAEKFTESLEFLSVTPAHDHDLGFLVFNSYGHAFRLETDQAKKDKYKEVILMTTDTMATLINDKVGTMLSWPRAEKLFGWPYSTIMDNMINLEMMFWAAKNGGEEHKYLYDKAVRHADVTMANHFRPDYTSYHVAVYDPNTGEFIKGVTHQGLADDSMWARGQSWAIYGYTVMYRETKDPKYLDFVQKVVDVYLKDLPEDYVPYWDFSDPRIADPNAEAPRDASAAAVVASALLELSEFLPGEKGDSYKADAIKMLTSLSSDEYQSGEARVSFLDHSTGHHPAGSEIDASIIYADYYYIEALHRLKRVQNGEPAFLEFL
ncbi:MAG: glycoside hydrolase family 88 protein [Rikenellaceae bacterium]